MIKYFELNNIMPSTNLICFYFYHEYNSYCRSRWPRGLRRRSAATRLLRSWVRIPPGAWMFVCCECCVLSGRGLCDELITRPKESYRLWSVVVCDLENLKNEEAMTRVGSQRHRKKKSYYSVDVPRYSEGTRGLNWESPYTNNFVLNHTGPVVVKL